MNYKSPFYPNLGDIGAPMNPLLIDQAVALGPTRVMEAPEAGYTALPRYNLNGWREAMEVFSASSFLFPE